MKKIALEIPVGTVLLATVKRKHTQRFEFLIRLRKYYITTGPFNIYML